MSTISNLPPLNTLTNAVLIPVADTSTRQTYYTTV